MEDLFNVDTMTFLCGQKEKTTSGNEHYQAFVQFKLRVRKTAVLKVFKSGQWRIEQRRGSLKQAIEYTKKEDSRLEPWVGLGVMPVGQGKTKPLDEAIEMIQAGATTRAVYEAFPRVAVLHGRKMDHYRSVVMAPTDKRLYKLEDFKEWEPIDDWTDTVIFWGGSQIGKTQFALAHFENPLLVSHLDDLKRLDKHDGIVFDDMSFTHLHREMQIHICDVENNRSINVKHGVVIIPAGMKRIMTTNVEHGNIVNDDEAINNRVNIVHLEGPVLRKPPKKLKAPRVSTGQVMQRFGVLDK